MLSNFMLFPLVLFFKDTVRRTSPGDRSLFKLGPIPNTEHEVPHTTGSEMRKRTRWDDVFCFCVLSISGNSNKINHATNYDLCHSIKLTVRTCILQRWKTNGVCVCLFPPTCWSLVHFKVTCRSRNSTKGLRSCDVAMRNI